MAAKPAAPAGAGYSATPLAKKIGLSPGVRVCVLNAPFDYRSVVAPWPEGARLDEVADRGSDVVHLFVREHAPLARELARLRRSMRDDAVLWVSWPKKAARIETDVSEDVVRELALPLGWVDIKVCAIDAVWSGLKLVVRRELRA
jgi:hypothetical protein